MKQFWVKFANLAAIIAILYGYQLTLSLHESMDETARLSAELAEASAKYQTARRQAQEKADAEKETSADEDDGPYRDGTYTGEADGYGGPVSVEVTVAQGNIADISVVSAKGEDPAYLSMAETVLDMMMERQSADVDAVSGATFSSAGIINAAAAALGKAGK